jgi:hypothetical protein
MEETDLSIQLFVADWQIYETAQLRVLHDTDLKHHASLEKNAGAITNVGLFAFLHYPAAYWGFGLLQVANRVVYSLRMGRLHGVFSGIAQIPADCYHNRKFRQPIEWTIIRRFLDLRRTAGR